MRKGNGDERGHVIILTMSPILSVWKRSMNHESYRGRSGILLSICFACS